MHHPPPPAHGLPTGQGLTRYGANGEAWRAPEEPILVTEPERGPWINNTQWGKGVEFETTLPGPLPGAIWGVNTLDRLPGNPSRAALLLGRAAGGLHGAMPQSAVGGLRALITVGVGALSRQLLCDWPRGGTAIVVPASTVTVQAMSWNPGEAVTPGSFEPGNIGTILSVQITRSTTAGVRAQFTNPFFPVPNTGTVQFTLPDHARDITFLTTVPASFYAAGTEIRFIGDSGVISRVLGSQILPGTKLPIPGDAFAVKINNNSGADYVIGSICEVEF